jgi:hypothetical protein
MGQARLFSSSLKGKHKIHNSSHKLSEPEFVRQQLWPICGGLAPHLNLTFSQAEGQFIFGAKVESVLRSKRDGFRMGRELRINTDLEYRVWQRFLLMPCTA